MKLIKNTTVPSINSIVDRRFDNSIRIRCLAVKIDVITSELLWMPSCAILNQIRAML